MSNLADTSRTTYDRFVEFERMMGVYRGAVAGRPYNPTPIGYAAFATTLFVYSFYICGATVQVTASPAMAMGLALFYGGLIQLIAGIFELRIGNNFYALSFCSYAGFWFSLGALYVTGSFGFQAAMTDTTAINNALGVFFLAWTIFTLLMILASIRTNVLSVVFYFFLMVVYILLTAAYFLNAQNDLKRAAGAIGIFTAVIGWYKAFANFLIRGDNAYFALPLFDISRRSVTDGGLKGPVETR